MSRVVVKVGGAVAEDSAADVLALAAAGQECVVVHGAGPQISAELARRGIPVSFVRGRRVTDEAAIGVVREALLAVNTALCDALGDRARGLLGDEIGLRATRIPELGLVGDPLPSRPPAVLEALESGLIPVVAPLAEGPLNVNADEAAAALAIGLGADRLMFLTDVPGVLRGDGVMSRIEAGEADRLLGDGTFQGGIVPKLEAALHAARSGVPAQIGATEVIP
jgi:acetylglutamate kinase